MRTTTRVMVVERERVRLVGWRALRVYVRARRNGTRLLAAAVAIGILFMVIHWG
jgi:hypothetical protein